MIARRLLATLTMVLVVGPEALAQTPSPERIDRVPVTSVPPAPGQPSYDESVEWLSGHTKLHCGMPFQSIDGTRGVSRSHVSASKRPCVLVEIEDSAAVRGSQSVRTTTVYLISLPLITASAIEVAPSKQHPLYTCVHMKGAEGMAIKLVPAKGEDDFKEERLSVDSLCFDTAGNAERAANALKHLAGLCGASAKKEPF